MFVLLICAFLALVVAQKEKACADFNIGAAQATLAGLENVFVCPADGIARVQCSESYPVKNVSLIAESKLSFDDIVIYILVGPNSRYDAFEWWLRLMTEPIDLVIIADPCPNQAESCADGPSNMHGILQKQFPLLRFHLFRVLSHDVGYKLLSCKLRTGAKMIYEAFPTRKYYFKIDTDTIVLPKRFITFLRTLDAVAVVEKQALYFGTVTESGMGLLLCGWDFAKDKGDLTKGGLCYGQGGAGYGLNNYAMAAIAMSTPCDPVKPDYAPEDAFIAYRMYEMFKVSAIHCGGFSSSELVTDRRMRGSITFHYIDSKWLTVYGNTLLKHVHGGD